MLAAKAAVRRIYTGPRAVAQSTDLHKPEAQEWSCCIKARMWRRRNGSGTGDVKADVEWPTESCGHIRLAR